MTQAFLKVLVLVDWKARCKCVRECGSATMCGDSSAGSEFPSFLPSAGSAHLAPLALSGGEKQQRASRFLAKMNAEILPESECKQGRVPATTCGMKLSVVPFDVQLRFAHARRIPAALSVGGGGGGGGWRSAVIGG